MPVPTPFRKLVIVACSAVALAACTDVPLSTVAALNRLDPATLDPRAIRIALITPTTFQPNAGQPELILTTGISDSPTEMWTFEFAERHSLAERAPLLGELRPGTELRVFGMEAGPAAELQRVLTSLSATPGDRERELAIAAEISGCVTEPTRKLPATIYVSFAPNEPYRVLLRSSDLVRHGSVTGLPLC